jgi:hypothetical protein
MQIRNLFKDIIKDITAWAHNENSPEAEPVNYTNPFSKQKRLASSPDGHGTNVFEDMNKGMNLIIYRASGGTIVQTYERDIVSDRIKSSLYVITDKENLGEEIGMIITRENLSR